MHRLSSEKGKTVTIIRVGTTQKYSDGWMSAFGGKKKSASNGAGSTKAGAKAAAPKAGSAKSTAAKTTAKKAKPAPKKKAKR